MQLQLECTEEVVRKYLLDPPEELGQVLRKDMKLNRYKFLEPQPACLLVFQLLQAYEDFLSRVNPDTLEINNIQTSANETSSAEEEGQVEEQDSERRAELDSKDGYKILKLLRPQDAPKHWAHNLKVEDLGTYLGTDSVNAHLLIMGASDLFEEIYRLVVNLMVIYHKPNRPNETTIAGFFAKLQERRKARGSSDQSYIEVRTFHSCSLYFFSGLISFHIRC